MNYTRLLKADIANGPGFRLTLWVTGCMRKCPGCFNEEAQDPKFGQKFDESVKEKIFKELAEPTCDGLSLMGGEPLSRCSDNRKQIIQLCKECKERFPDKDIWCWSGFLFEEILKDSAMRPILNYIDVLVDGPFVQEKKDLSTPFRGSTNQRIIDIKKTMELKHIVNYKI
jgi:anaerobic ribonucleoside-triphosphate reductase activating protein